MIIARLAGIDPLAQIAIGGLVATLIITFGLGGWVLMHLIKKDTKKAK